MKIHRKYRSPDQRSGVATARQVQGKQLSYNNINDTDAAYECVAEFDPKRTAACALIKHANPCGVAEGESLLDAYRKALQVYTREQLPQGWAAIQNNLGAALADLAESSEGAQAAGRARESRLYSRQHRVIRRAPNIATKAAHLSENCIDYAYGRNLGELRTDSEETGVEANFSEPLQSPETWGTGPV